MHSESKQTAKSLHHKNSEFKLQDGGYKKTWGETLPCALKIFRPLEAV
jgi:hypothetical protein